METYKMVKTDAFLDDLPSGTEHILERQQHKAEKRSEFSEIIEVNRPGKPGRNFVNPGSQHKAEHHGHKTKEYPLFHYLEGCEVTRPGWVPAKNS
jgi:hypothetical protein